MLLSQKKQKNLALVSVAVVFMALIRTLAECFRMEYAMQREITLSELRPFIYAAMVASVTLFTMTLLMFRQRYTWIIVSAVTTIVCFVIIKMIYLT